MSSEWGSDPPSPITNGHSKVLPQKSPTEREMRTRTHLRDHPRLQVAVKRETLLSGETKDDEFHRAVMHVECSEAGLLECHKEFCC